MGDFKDNLSEGVVKAEDAFLLEMANFESKKVFNKGIMDLRQIALLEMSGQECRLNKDYLGWCDVLEALISKLSCDIKADDVANAEEKVKQARLAIQHRNPDVARHVLHETEKMIFLWEKRLNISNPSVDNYQQNIDQPDLDGGMEDV